MISRKLQGKVLEVTKTGEQRKNQDEDVWEKCVFRIKLTHFSKSTHGPLPPNLEGKEIMLVRWCCFDWHYNLGATKTLEPDETEAVIHGSPTSTVYW